MFCCSRTSQTSAPGLTALEPFGKANVSDTSLGEDSVIVTSSIVSIKPSPSSLGITFRTLLLIALTRLS